MYTHDDETKKKALALIEAIDKADVGMGSLKLALNKAKEQADVLLLTMGQSKSFTVIGIVEPNSEADLLISEIRSRGVEVVVVETRKDLPDHMKLDKPMIIKNCNHQDPFMFKRQKFERTGGPLGAIEKKRKY